MIEIYKEEVSGVRIEDMFVVQSNEPLILSDDLPKTVYDIERFISNSRS